MKALVKKYVEVNLILRIVIGLAIGVVLALIIPTALAGTTEGSVAAGILGFFDGLISVFGALFVGALKGIAPVLVFLLVSGALASANVGSGAIMKRVILLYIIGTVAAALLATVMSFVCPVNMVFSGSVDTSKYTAPGGLGDVVSVLLTNLVSNPIDALAKGNYLGILFWAVLTGLALRVFATDHLKANIKSFSSALTEVVRWIIQFAPFGIMGLIYSAVSESGISIFTNYFALLGVLVGCMLFMFLVVNPLIVFINIRKNPYPLVFKCIAKSAITAFFTRSSAANIPVNMALCEELGLEEDSYSISIPLGATINMEGAAITISVMTLAACNTLGIQVDLPTAVLLSIVAAIGACGASGVAGGSLLLIPMACGLFGIPADIAMNVVAVGFIIGVVQDSFETALNSSTDVLFTATAEMALKNKRKKLAEETEENAEGETVEKAEEKTTE